MSADDQSYYWHLTIDNGWIERKRNESESEVPPGRVLTLCFRLFQSSPFTREENWTEHGWEHPDKNLVERALGLYGNRPPGFENWPEDRY